jgi:hypothetical protein
MSPAGMVGTSDAGSGDPADGAVVGDVVFELVVGTVVADDPRFKARRVPATTTIPSPPSPVAVPSSSPVVRRREAVCLLLAEG